MRIIIFTIYLLLFASASAEQKSEEELLAEYKSLIKELRCPKCTNQSLADSPSVISGDLKNIVLKRLRLGDTPDEVRDFLIVRYGDFIVYAPPMQKTTVFLWFAPLVIFLIGGLGGFFLVRRHYFSKKI